MKLKKLLAAAVSVVTLAAAVPMQSVQDFIDDFSLTASARLRGGDVVDSGNCGTAEHESEVTWTLTQNNEDNSSPTYTLTISGTGAMADYTDANDLPWMINLAQITDAEIASGVTSIGEGAFFNCGLLTSITIPGSVKSIGNDAFLYCTSLTSITIPNSVESIGYLAFASCKSLASITIPDSVESIGNYAFDNCSKLKTVIFQGNVPTSVGIDIFDRCPNELKIFYKNDGEIGGKTTTNYTTNSDESHGTCGKDSAPVYWVLAENGKLPNTDTTAYKLYIFGTGEMKVSEVDYNEDGSIRLINRTLPWEAQIAKNTITDIEISDGVKNIDHNAFSVYRSLKNVTIPDSVTNIGHYAFYGCKSLKSITIPDSVTSIGVAAFFNCKSLKSITIPGSVTSIDEGAFYNCEDLSEVTFKDEKTIKTWGQRLFYNSVSNDDALNPKITKVNFKYMSSTSNEDLKKMFPESCEFTYQVNDTYHAPAYETYEQNGLTFHLWDDHAELAECDVNKESVEIPAEVDGQPVTEIGENAFNSCKALTEVKIPDSVKKIGASAFWGCTSLKTIIIPKSVTEIGKDIFKRCTSFEAIYGYTGSAAEAFANANSYTFIALDEVVTTVTTETAQTTTTTTIITTVTTASTATESGTTAVTTTNLKPSAPTNVTISADGTVTWDKVDNAVQYKVFKKYGGTAYYSGWVTDNSYRFKSLPREDYEIYVAAQNKYGTSWSKHLQVKVENPLGTVRKVNVSNGTVSWNAVQGAVAYKVAKVVNGKTYYGSKTNDASYTFKYVPSKDYKVFVVAFDKDGNRTWGKKLDIKA